MSGKVLAKKIIMVTRHRNRLLCLLKTALIFSIAISTTSSNSKSNCSSQNAEPQLRLVNLYNSEGRDSCPSTEKWMASFSNHAQFAGLEFHVDYRDSFQLERSLLEPCQHATATGHRQALQYGVAEFTHNRSPSNLMMEIGRGSK